MRIALALFDASTLGGTERATLSLLELFQKEKDNINVSHIISFSKKEGKNSFSFDKHVPIKLIPYNSDSFEGTLKDFIEKENIDKLIFQADLVKVTKRLLKTLEYTDCKPIPIYHGSPMSILYKQWVLKKRSDLFFIPFKVLFFHLIQKNIKKLQFKNTFKKAETIVFVSKGTAFEAKKIINNSNVFIKSIENVTPNNLIELSKKNLTNKEFLKDKKNKVVYMSRLELGRQKNSMMILRVWKYISRKYSDWELIILGDGDARNVMENYIKRESLKNVNIMGFVKDPTNILQESKIISLTSNTEGFNLSLIEGAACGNAIISTNSYGGIKDYLKQDFNGLVSEIGDVDGMVSNLEELIKDEEKLYNLQKNALKMVRDFNQEKIYKSWEEVLLK